MSARQEETSVVKVPEREVFTKGEKIVGKKQEEIKKKHNVVVRDDERKT